MRPNAKWFLVASPFLWACTATVPVELNARVGTPTTAASVGRVQQALEVTSGIDVTRVRLLVRELELEREGDDSDDGVDAGSADAGESEVDHDDEQEVGPFVIDLSGAELEGQLVSLPGLAVQPGTYDEIEYTVAVPSDDEVGSDAAVAEMKQQGATVIIDGTIDGQPFSFVSKLSVEQEREARFTVGEGDASVTFNLDASRWFVDEAGQRLDPRNGENLSRIEDNIKRSLDAFDDDDHDGAEDHDDDGSEG